jgi:hypothetical protein
MEKIIAPHHKYNNIYYLNINFIIFQEQLKMNIKIFFRYDSEFI